MKQIIFKRNFFLFIFIILIILVLSLNLYAQEQDTLEKIIKGNEFLLKSNFNMNIGLGVDFQNFATNYSVIEYYIFYDFSFSYELFNWLSFYTNLRLTMSLDYWYLFAPYLFFTTDFNELIRSLPFQWNLKAGIFYQDLSISSYFSNDDVYYYGIAPFNIRWALGSILMDIKWWLLELSVGVFGLEQSAGFGKLIFSFYDFAYLSATFLAPININSSNDDTSLFIELAMTTGLFDIMIYFLPTTYYDTTLAQDQSIYCFGLNISMTFNISNSHKLKVKLFGDYNDPNSAKGYSLIDYLNELYYPSTYSFSQKHPSRAGLGLEYNGQFNKVLSIFLASYIYYNFSSNSVIFNGYLKAQFYYFYLDFHYFPYYYPILDNNILSISLGINFSF